MNANEALINYFYSCFQQKDVKGMQDCYADNVVFSDPVFQNLNADEVRSMWAMLMASGKDMHIEFKNIKADQANGTAEWDAQYTFSTTGNKVLNKVKASFIFENGKIISHQDQFDFYVWSKQALGLTGLLLGWTGFLKNKIRTKARKNLQVFMEKTTV